MSNVNIALSTESLKKLFNAIAGQDGIDVVWDPECKTPKATIDRVITMAPPGGMDGLEFWFKSFHELGHLLHEMDWSYTTLAKYVNPEDELVLVMCNILVDHLEERNFQGHFEGVDNILDEGRAMMLKRDWMKLTPDEFKEIEKNPVNMLILGTMIAEAQLRQFWGGTHVESLPVCDYTHYFPELRKGLGRIKFLSRLDALADNPAPARECGQLVLDLLGLIGYEPPPPEGEGEGDGEGDGEGQGQGMSQDESQEGEGEETGQAVTSDTMNPYDLDENDPMYNPDGMGTGPIEGSGTITGAADIDLPSVLKALQEDLKQRLKDQPKRETPNRYDGTYVPHAKHDVRDLEKDGQNFRVAQRQAIVQALGNSTVSKSIGKYLKALTSESYTYGQKRGKIHQKNIHKIVGAKASPGVQPGIFKRKNSAMLKSDSAVTLLMDCSGSMSGSKYTIAAACCVALSETLTGLGIAHEILGFSEEYDLVTYVFKSFGSTLTKQKALNLMANSSINLYSNSDGESLMYAAERLMFRKERRKLLIVLSDGMPCGHYYGDGRAYLKHVCKMIEDESPIDLVGIGIKTTAVEMFYKNNVVVDNPSMLDETLFKVLKGFLT